MSDCRFGVSPVNYRDPAGLFVSESINRVNEITGKTIPFHIVDVLDKKGLQDLFSKVT